MFELVKEILTSPGGSFACIMLVGLFFFWMYHWVTVNIVRIRSEHKNTMDNNKTIIENQDKVCDKLENKVDYLTRSMNDLFKDIALIKGIIESSRRNIGDELTQRKSPISLTEKGYDEVEKYNLNSIVDNNWNTIYSNLEKDVTCKNPYDIQTYCIETAFAEPEKFFTQDDILKIKNIAFKNGYALMSYTNILGVLIRDKYFQQKGIKIEEIDKHDPHITQND